MSLLIRSTGAILLALVALPAFNLLDGREIGIMGEVILDNARDDAALLLQGTPIALAVGVLLARIAGVRIGELVAALGRHITGIRVVHFATAAAVIAALYAALFSLLILDGKANLVDAMAQLQHARFLAAGRLAGPVDESLAFWHLHNSIATPQGWVSHFPPGHAALLALGFRIGAVWAIGPAMLGIAIFCMALAAERLLPDDRGVARLGVIFAALSPFLIAHAGAYMNHTPAAAGIAATAYCALRARDKNSFFWAALSGVAAGFAFTIRPFSAIVGGVVALAMLASNTPNHPRPGIGRWLQLAAAVALGALPFGLAMAWYNNHFFGDPLTFGYTATWGPATAPGFHRDPWGNAYGPVEAIGFTSSDLTSLSLRLIEAPLPFVLVIGLYLLLARRLKTGERLVALWALLPVAANAYYWHHGMFMGPRMLNEAAPAWALLAAVGSVGLARMIPRGWEWHGYNAAASSKIALVAAALAGILYLGPERLRWYGAWLPSTRIELPLASRPSLLFVHGGWTNRIAARLSAAGMRLDSVETALRLNPSCAVHHFSLENWRVDPAGFAERYGIDLRPRYGELLPRLEVSRGNVIRSRPGALWSQSCRREIHSDRLGVVDMAPLAWQGDIPGAGRGGMMVVRDMGPKANAALIEAHPQRIPMIFMRQADHQPPVLMSYGTGAVALWPSNTP